MAKKKENLREIDVHQVDLSKLKQMAADEPGLLKYAAERGGALVDPVDKGKLKGRAVDAMYQQTGNQLEQILEQMKVLATQYEGIKERIEFSERVYLAKVNFETRVNHVYHLYATKKGEDILSLVGPEDWGKTGHPYQEFLCSLKLLADHTWEVVTSGENLD